MEGRLSHAVQLRADRGLLRRLTHSQNRVDFSSNDYLGYGAC